MAPRKRPRAGQQSFHTRLTRIGVFNGVSEPEQSDICQEELVNLKLMSTVEDIAQAVTDEARKSNYGHKVTKASFLKAMERSKKIFENDSLMLKFLEKVSSALTSLE